MNRGFNSLGNTNRIIEIRNNKKNPFDDAAEILLLIHSFHFFSISLGILIVYKYCLKKIIQKFFLYERKKIQ